MLSNSLSVSRRQFFGIAAAMGLACAFGGNMAFADDAAKMEGEISVYSREDGSGTRGAFIELFGIEQKDADGNKVDMTTDMAMITNSTAVMMTTVAGDEQGIGYISWALSTTLSRPSRSTMSRPPLRTSRLAPTRSSVLSTSSPTASSTSLTRSAPTS